MERGNPQPPAEKAELVSGVRCWEGGVGGMPGTGAEVGRAPGPECVSECACGHTQGGHCVPHTQRLPQADVGQRPTGISVQIQHQASVSCLPITRVLPGARPSLQRLLEHLPRGHTGDAWGKGRDCPRCQAEAHASGPLAGSPQK